MKSINSDVAYDYLKRRILSGEYPPGSALMTNVLAEEIGVSRTPIRDALRQLVADGLVIIEARAGAKVKQMDLREFREVCELRLALESHAAGLAARNRHEDDLYEISQALEGMRQLTEEMGKSGANEEKMLPDLVREDVRFHLAIMTAAKCDSMKKEILRLHLINRVIAAPLLEAAKSAPAERPGDARRREVLVSHDEIFEAIKRADVPAAKRAMEHHLQDMIDRTLRTMARRHPGMVRNTSADEEAIYSA